jgi:hypothetical protein
VISKLYYGPDRSARWGNRVVSKGFRTAPPVGRTARPDATPIRAGRGAARVRGTDGDPF